MFDALFRFFFELSPVVFSQGEFRFAASTGSYVAAAAVAVAAGLTVAGLSQGPGPAARASHRARRHPRSRSSRIILVCMFRPLLVVKAAVPQQNFLGVLLDDSRSMQIADVDGQPRAAFVQERVRRRRSRPAQGAVGSLHRPHVPVLVARPRARRRKAI